jgi:hypothetical protein
LPNGKERRKMAKWEYLSISGGGYEWEDTLGRSGRIETDRDWVTGLISLFNEYGEEGWELVFETGNLYFFKRLKQED